MERVCDYRIVHAGSIEGLERIVKACMINGWQPIGGVFMEPNGLIYQALVHFEEESKQ